MNSSKNNTTINPEIITLVDDDEVQQNIRIAERSNESTSSTTTSTELSNSPIVKKADKVGNRRRKTFHKVLNADDEITFESVIPGDEISKEVIVKNQPSSSNTETVKQTKIPKLNKNYEYVESIDKMNLKKRYPIDYLAKENPNNEFMQRVAFLRSCVNYMLQNAGKEAINFNYGDNTLSKLVNNYNCVSNEPEEIVLSD